MARYLRRPEIDGTDLGPPPSRILRLSVKELHELADLFRAAWPNCRAALEIDGLADDITAIRRKRRRAKKR